VPSDLEGRTVSVKALFDLGPLSPAGRRLESKPLEVKL
jgi:hypothetical protein